MKDPGFKNLHLDSVKQYQQLLEIQSYFRELFENELEVFPDLDHQEEGLQECFDSLKAILSDDSYQMMLQNISSYQTYVPQRDSLLMLMDQQSD